MMLTVEDYLKYKETVNQESQNACDEWLENTVFPKFTNNGCGFECPTFAAPLDVVRMLRQRGWEVRCDSGYQGTFVYLSIPEQGK